MKVELVHSTPDGDKLIAEIARVSNPSNQKNEETAPRLIRYLIQHQHWSPFQMVSACISIETTRDIGRQILRHQSAVGFQEFSGRYAAYGDLLHERECRFQDPTNRQSSRMPETETELETAEWWNRKVKQIAALTQDVYDESLQRGIAKECARAVLPEGLVPTRMYFHGSLRTWMHYVGERTKAGVQKEHRLIAQECEKVLTEHFPNSMIAFRNLNA